MTWYQILGVGRTMCGIEGYMGVSQKEGLSFLESFLKETQEENNLLEGSPIFQVPFSWWLGWVVWRFPP